MNDLHKFPEEQTKQEAKVKSLDARKDPWSASRYCHAKQLQCFILAWRQAVTMPFPSPHQKKRSFQYLGGNWESWDASGVQSFYPDRPGEILSSPHAMPQSLHVTNCISRLLFCHYKVQDYFRVCSSGNAVAPYKWSARPLRVGSLS